MASPTYTFALTNGTTADASQVQTNFNDILNGVTDGTKDISVAALTAAGNAAFNGNTSIGNAAADDLSITASLASSIPIKTTNSFDIGAATLGLRALYFGANSQTVKVQGSASMSATWTLTLPVTAGTANFALITDGAGVSSWSKFFPGAVDGASQSVGNVGQEIVSTFSAVSIVTGADRTTGCNVALTAGNWLLTALVEHNGTSAMTALRIGLKTTDADLTGLTAGVSSVFIAGNAVAGVSSGSIPNFPVRISTAATHYLNANATNANATISGCLRAIRIY